MLGGKQYFGSWDETWGRAAAHIVVEAHPEVDAIFCGSDQIARGVLESLRDLRRDVPGSIAVTGFDNWEAVAAHSRPRLTSVDMNLEHLGAAAGRRLFAAIDGGEPLTSDQLPGRIVMRDSTAHAR
jgi:LacI family transcriptional regulator